ncbi:MAG: hypothetical protein OXI96_02380 [Acidimicrobiaceae bacterium]|nr:hypothetical protein [Acidimicrobiaceae bacterium]
MVLTLLSFLDKNNRLWVLVILVAVFVFIHTIVSVFRDQNIVRRLGKRYDEIQRNAVQIIASLGDLSGNHFDLWMVDLYLPSRRWYFMWKIPFIGYKRKLSRQLAVSLVDVSTAQPSYDLKNSPHGQCFTSAKSRNWYNKEYRGNLDIGTWGSLDETGNSELASNYGILSLSPIVDQLGRNCAGVLVVHVKPQEDKILRAIGVLQSSRGKRLLHNACITLHGLLMK